MMRAGPFGYAVLALWASACHGSSSAGDAGPAELAPVDKSPPRAPPAVRGARVVTPPRPDLPALEAHEPEDPVPVVSVGARGTCGVWNGSSLVSLVCAKSAVLFGVGDGGAVSLIPESLLHAAEIALPSVVDHRADGSEGPVRDQRESPACTAFSMASAIDHALLRWAGKPPPVSVMQIWSRYKTPTERSSIGSNLGMALGTEGDWPFNAREADGWLPCPDSGKRPAAGCGLPINPGHAQKVESRTIAKLTRVEYLKASDIPALEEKLAAGQDVIVTMIVPKSFATKGRAGARYVPHYAKVPDEESAHALLLAGYAKLRHGTYFLAHNSWGAAWGDAGYAWIHQATLETWAREALVLDAELDSPSPSQRPKRRRGETPCPGDLVPDSIRGTCAARCADGSPRHDGVCGSTSGCLPGHVNLTGACVLAAPQSKGTEPKRGISWTCGAGGCTYLVPRALDRACTGNVCMTSCPAPDFHLASAEGELTCIE